MTLLAAVIVTSLYLSLYLLLLRSINLSTCLCDYVQLQLPTVFGMVTEQRHFCRASFQESIEVSHGEP